MRKLCLLVVGFFLITSSVASQSYDFNIESDSYVPLNNSTSINNGSIWASGNMFNIPIGFPFKFMEVDFTNVTFEGTGRLIFDADHLFFADMIVSLNLRDKGDTTSLSPLSYELTGSSGDRILKIEISNATYGGGSTVNFQIWLYEGTNTIELHMGEYTSSFATDVFSGIHGLSTFDPTTFIYSLSLSGNPLTPTELVFSGEGNEPFTGLLDDAPPSNTIYRFTDNSALSVDTFDYINNIQLYPTLASTEITVDFTKSDIEDIRSIELYTISGRKIKTIEYLDQQTQKIDLQNLEVGIYVIIISDFQNKQVARRFIKKP